MLSDHQRSALAVLLISTVCTTGQSQVVQPFRPAPLFAGTSLPDPPHQREAWTPPRTKLPEKCVTSIQAIVRYGFANPRGCEYREVEVPCGSVWGGSAVFKTHGWILPPNQNEAQRFAVTWSGIVYPAIAVGDAADLKADVAVLANKEPSQYGNAAPQESERVSYQSVSETKVCMLLLLGETDAAEKLWKRLQPPAEYFGDDPFLHFVHEYAWAHYDRAVCAHMHGDDVISLISAQAAARLRGTIERDAVVRGVKRPPENLAKPNLVFLKNVDALVADQQRRVAAPKVERVLDVGLDKFPDPNQRIAALIRDLEEVSARQWGQPGGVDLGQDRIMHALVNEGEAAIEPLIACFESDTRLTRSVSFHRSFFTSRSFLGVDDAAYRAISGILKVRNFGPQTEHGYYSPFVAAKRAEVAKEIRAYWNKVRSIGELDRWYQTLADDSASREQWLDVIRKITRPAPREPGAIVPPPIVAAMSPPRPMAGEGLRQNRTPSVTELLFKRAEAISRMDSGTSLRTVRMADACEVALALAKWDPATAMPEVKNRIQQGFALLDDSFYGSGNFRLRLIPQVAQLCAWANEAGDSETVDQYVAWVSKLTPERVEKFKTYGEFYTLLRFPDEPRMAAAAKALFLNAGSPWRPLHDRVSGPLFREFLSAPYIGVPAIREMIKQELQNAADSGATLKIDRKDQSYSVTLPGEGSGGRPRDVSDPNWIASHDQSLRVCDRYAWSLNALEGSPLFEPYWPQDRRDAAIAELIAFLDQWGNCFRVLPTTPPDRFGFPFNQAGFHIAKLDRVATPEDVKQARAIFSLQGEPSQTRVAELPMFPKPARWKTLDKFPVRYPGQTAEQTQYDQAGYIWQAEEIIEGGKWQRYYGFVGNHIIAKVPAEEIEFLERPFNDRFLRR